MTRGLVQFGFIAAALVLLASAPVHAQVRVTALDGRAWSDVVAALTQRLDAQGTDVALCVHEGDAPCLPCGTYALSFDADTAPAFAIGACDPESGATHVVLEDRSALFDHAHAIPVPRTATVHATLRSTEHTETATPRSAGSGVGCAVSLRPYVRDLEHGTLVYLTPDRYDVVVAREGLRVTPGEEGGFVVSSTERTATALSYDVVERASGEVVLVGRASLECASTTDVPATAPGTTSPEATTHDVERAAALANALPPAESGIHVRQHDGTHDVTHALMFTGGGVVVASVIGLVAVGLASAIQAQPTCARVSTDDRTPICLEWVPSTAPQTPADVTWTLVGVAGVGVALAVTSWIVDALLPTHDASAPRVLVDVGPTGGTLGLSMRF